MPLSVPGLVYPLAPRVVRPFRPESRGRKEKIASAGVEEHSRPEVIRDERQNQAYVRLLEKLTSKKSVAEAAPNDKDANPIESTYVFSFVIPVPTCPSRSV